MSMVSSQALESLPESEANQLRREIFDDLRGETLEMLTIPRVSRALGDRALRLVSLVESSYALPVSCDSVQVPADQQDLNNVGVVMGLSSRDRLLDAKGYIGALPVEQQRKLDEAGTSVPGDDVSGRRLEKRKSEFLHRLAWSAAHVELPLNGATHLSVVRNFVCKEPAVSVPISTRNLVSVGFGLQKLSKETRAVIFAHEFQHAAFSRVVSAIWPTFYTEVDRAEQATVVERDAHRAGYNIIMASGKFSTVPDVDTLLEPATEEVRALLSRSELDLSEAMLLRATLAVAVSSRYGSGHPLRATEQEQTFYKAWGLRR